MLPYYLDLQPAKSFGEIYLETNAKPQKLPPPDDGQVKDIANRLATDDPAKLVSRVDDLLTAARLNYTDSTWSNLLLDVKDALLSGADRKAIADYINWRVDNSDWFKVPPHPGDEEYPDKNPHISGSANAIELEKRAEEAPAALKPNWLYLRGALNFLAGDRTECERWFDRVRTEFPQSPRAGIATYMSGRCELWQSRSDPEDQNQAHRDKALSLFQEYLDKHPSGELAADAWGWMGALYSDAGNRLEAIQSYINQLNVPGHPEVVKSALFMCEDTLQGTTPQDNALFNIVSKNPVVAMGMTYLVLNTAQAPQTDDQSARGVIYDDDSPTLADSARAKKWRDEILPKIGAAVAAQKDQYKPQDWQPRYLAMLTQAASAAGNQDEALKISAIPTQQLDGSDDLLFARAVAYQRAGRPPEAIAAYRQLLASFPSSQLADGAQLKLALALQDDHQAGQAILELKKLATRLQGRPGWQSGDSIYPPAYDRLTMADSFVSRNISGVANDQVDQILDTLYNFAPLEELEVCAQGPEDVATGDMRAIIAERYLEEENFAKARQFMTDSQYQLCAAKLEKLTDAVAKAKGPRARADAMSALGDTWEGARGKLLKFPLDSLSALGVFADWPNQAGLRRRENGLALGFKDTDAILENRDELRHAARWWMRAARLVPGSALDARDRWKALKAMPEIAAASEFAFQRAVETNAGAVSRALYDRLRSECPDSGEAKKYAAWWSFPMPPKRQAQDDFVKFKGSKGDRQIDAIGQMGYRDLDYGTFGPTRDFVESDYESQETSVKPWPNLGDEILALNEHSAEWDTARLADEVNRIRSQFLPLYNAPGDVRFINLLDDLTLFLKEPNLTPAMRKAYIELRLRYNGFLNSPGYGDSTYRGEQAEEEQEKRIGSLMDDPVLKPASDYVDFIRAVEDGKASTQISTPDVDRDGTPIAIDTKDYNVLAKSMRDFLKAHPQSAKREAATLILARALHWLSTPIYKSVAVSEDDEVRPYWRTQSDFNALTTVLDDYEREFPNGRYAADIREYHADSDYQQHDWAPALDLTIKSLDDSSHPELQPQAALRLANIFAALADEHYRSDLIGIIRQRPEAVHYLQLYLSKIWYIKDHPLRFLGSYLSDQLGIQIPPPLKEDPPTD